MALAAGIRLGAYEILSLLGKGGMGEVYRARDTKLGRDVALKILPDAFTTDPERLARFRREAQVLASLNHPYIGAIYGLDESSGQQFLVLELVDGESLDKRIARGAIPVDEALGIAKQIAEALEAAHEKGIIHRDLKPANIALTKDGNVKVLDFGLAKAMEPATGQSFDFANSPTITSPAMLTGIGMILGTAAYMAPEQAKGKSADKRSDIWAFGCVVYEMLTGKRTFHGDDVTDTIASVLTHEPDWSALPIQTPQSIRKLLRRSLGKDRKRRLHDIGDARLDLEEALSDGGEDHTHAGLGGLRHRFFWPVLVSLVAAIAAVSAGTAWYAVRRAPSAPSRPLKRFVIDMRATPLNESPVPLALSPDGTKLAYATGSYEGSQLNVRLFAQRDPKPLAGTLSAFNPFFSPDSQWIGFSSSTGLKKVPATGGPVVTLSATDFTRVAGATWAADGSIFFAIGESGGLWKIAVDGGNREPVTKLEAGQGEVGHVWPDLLPGGKAILFTILTSTAPDADRVAVQSLDSKTHRVLVEGAAFGRYVPSGHLVYAQAGTLFAAPFDVERLTITGPAVVLLDSVSMDSGRGNARVSISHDGTLAFVEAAPRDRRSLVWVDRRGSAIAVDTPQRGFQHPSLSPDGKRLIIEVHEGTRKDLWLYGLENATFTRLTSDGSSDFPVWTPDGKRITFATRVSDRATVLSQNIEEFQPAESVVSASNAGFGVWPGSWTPDGQTLAFMQGSPMTGGDIAVFDRHREQSKPFVQTAATEWGAKLSPDGHWMAYISNESGLWEVYLQPFPGPGGRRQISTNGGTEIVWARSSQELFYRNGQRMMAVEIKTTPGFAVATPKVLFEGPYLLGSPGAHNYDVSPDGQRLLMIKASEQEESRSIHVMLNWFEELKARVPTK